MGSRHRREENNDTFNVSNLARSFDSRPNRGPLLTTALALFGPGSFIEDRMTRPAAHLYPNITFEQSREISGYYTCVDKAPFVGLLTSQPSNPRGVSVLDRCLTRNVHTHDHLQQQMATYAMKFYWNLDGHLDGKHITNAFTSAAFLANEAWLTSQLRGSWRVNYDYGADTVVPVISLTGIIVVSNLIGFFLVALLTLALYSASRARWTDQLDAFAILRIGTSISDDIQFCAADNVRKIKALDRLPGWIGDATEEEDLGQLGLGASGRLNSKRRFAAYDIKEKDRGM